MPSVKRKESLSSSAARMAYVLYLGQAFAVVVSVITFIALTRMLGPSRYGFYIFAVSFALIVGGMQNFGVGAYFARNLARSCSDNDARGISRTMSSGFALLIAMALVITIVGVGISGFVANVLFSSVGISSLSLVLASLWIFFMMLQNSAIMALVGLSRPVSAAVITVVIDIAQLAAILALLYLGMGVNGALLGMLLGYIAGAAIAVAYAVRAASRFRGFALRMPSKREFMQAFNFSAPLGLLNLFRLFTQNFSVLLLSVFVTAIILGNYSAALKGLSLTTTIFTTSSTFLIPVFSRAGHRSGSSSSKNRSYDKITLYSLIFSMPIIIYIAVMANPGLHILLSGNYASAPLYLTLIAFGTAINMISVSLGSLIISEGATRKYLYYSIVSVIVQVASMALLVPYLKVIGVIISVFIIGSMTSNLLSIRLAMKYIKARLSYLRMHLVLLANLILALPISAALLLPGHVLELLSGLIMMILAYPAILGLMRLVEKSDLDKLTSSTSGIRYFGSAIRWLCTYTMVFVGMNGAANA
jgi:O-antigen/teichoic acid export membrane protein